MCTHLYKHMYIRATFIHKDMHACIYIHIHTHIHSAYMHEFTHIHIHKHTCMHTNTYEYTHINTHRCYSILESFVRASLVIKSSHCKDKDAGAHTHTAALDPLLWLRLIGGCLALNPDERFTAAEVCLNAHMYGVCMCMCVYMLATVCSGSHLQASFLRVSRESASLLTDSDSARA
jgi:hypothetical protein